MKVHLSLGGRMVNISVFEMNPSGAGWTAQLIYDREVTGGGVTMDASGTIVGGVFNQRHKMGTAVETAGFTSELKRALSFVRNGKRTERREVGNASYKTRFCHPALIT